MTWLVLDVGNSAVKWALAGRDEFQVSDDHALSLDEDFAGRLLAALREPLARWEKTRESVQAVGCSVASDEVNAGIDTVLRPLLPGGVRWLTSQSRFAWRDLVLTNGYRDPAQLGSDRWHAMIAARQAHPAQPLVVVCAGTATTVDSVDAQGRFAGGVIAPGFALMRDSLAQGTARLPRSNGRAVPIPDNTDDAIATGVADAQAGLIERRVRVMAESGAPPRLVVGGGRARELAARLKADAAAGVNVEEHLVLRGLWLRAMNEGGERGAPGAR